MMTTYVVRQPLPLGLPVHLAPTARVCIADLDAHGRGRLVVQSPHPGFARAVRARLARCYGFRGRRLGTHVTRDDLCCAMACRPMQDLEPVRGVG